MDSIIRRYLRNRVYDMRKMMREAKESGLLYYAHCGAVVRRRSPYHFHARAIAQAETSIKSETLSERMVSLCISFLRKNYNAKVTDSLVRSLKKHNDYPYNMTDGLFYDYGTEVMHAWQAYLIRLLEAENRRMRGGNAIERLFKLKRSIVKPYINL